MFNIDLKKPKKTGRWTEYSSGRKVCEYDNLKQAVEDARERAEVHIENTGEEVKLWVHEEGKEPRQVMLADWS